MHLNAIHSLVLKIFFELVRIEQVSVSFGICQGAKLPASLLRLRPWEFSQLEIWNMYTHH